MKHLITSLLLAACILPLSAEVLKNDTFAKNLRGWNAPAYWAGKVSKVKVDGKDCLLLESGKRNDELFGRALGYNRNINYFPGDTVKITVKAKGEGKLACGALSYHFGKGQPNYCRDGARDLTSEFQTFTFTCKLNERFEKLLSFIEVQGVGKVYVESFHMETVVPASGSVKSDKDIQMASVKNPVKAVTFSTSLKNQEFTISLKNGNNVTYQKVKADSNGKISVATDKLTPGFWEISASNNGKNAIAYVEVQPENVYQATSNTAKKIKLAKPVRVLFLGDSLSDFYRGYNYIDRISFWVNKYNPGKFTFRNAGVGGDFCKRMEDRLNGALVKRNYAYRQNMYNGLFDEKFDIIFLFLGQNDTRSFRKTNFTKQETPPALQQKCLTNICKILKDKFPQAKIIMIAPSPSYEKLFLDRAKKWAPSNNMVMYGKKDLVDLYHAENKKFCAANNIPYIDILSVMRAAPSIKDLYVSDGVHLSPLGGRVIADEILKFLAK